MDHKVGSSNRDFVKAGQVMDTWDSCGFASGANLFRIGVAGNNESKDSFGHETTPTYLPACKNK